MDLAVIHICTRSACFELQNNTCYASPAPYRVLLNGKCVLEHGCTNVFSLFSLEPATSYQLEVIAGDDTGTLTFTTAPENFFVDASRYGLVNDGTTDNTAFLQAALSTCPPGGTIYVPAGTYRTQSLFLCSNTTLYLEKGCTLLGGTDRHQYPVLPGTLPGADGQHEACLGSWEGEPQDCFAGLLNIIHAENVTITGQGCIDANAQNGDWYQNAKVRVTAWRPRLFFASNANNITLHGVEVCNSYSWTIHPACCDGVNLLQLQIHNPVDSPNTDGINPESCKNVNIIGSSINVGDDCIALKSGKRTAKARELAPCENIIIRNCCLNRGHGGLVIGSEMSGGVKNVVVTQCLMDHTDRGLRIKTRRGRGKTAVVDGLVFRNVEMRHVLTPFVINMFYCCDADGKSDYVQTHDALPQDDGTPHLGCLTMENVTASDAEYAGCWFSGLPEQPIDKVEMRNVSISFAENAGFGQAAMMCGAADCSKLAIWAENVREIVFHNVKLEGYAGNRLNFIHVGSFYEE